MFAEEIRQGKDDCTGLFWCTAGREDTAAFAAAQTREQAQHAADERLEAFLRRRDAAPLLRLPGPGYGASRVCALAAAWEAVFHAAVRVKLRCLRVVPPFTAETEEVALFSAAASGYALSGRRALLRDCSMLKRYPVLGLDTGGKIYTGTGTARSEALLNCLESEILEREFGIETGIVPAREEASYPPSDPFHTEAGDALTDYIAMAERYGARPRAGEFSVPGLYIFQLFPETFDRRMSGENTLVFDRSEL